MGYYSDVRVATTLEGFDAFLSEMGSPDPEKWSHPSWVTMEVERFEDTGDVIFGWDQVNGWGPWDWMGDVEEALRQIEQAGHPFEYVRVGEGNYSAADDVEYTYGNPEALSNKLVHRIEPEVRIGTYVNEAIRESVAKAAGPKTRNVI